MGLDDRVIKRPADLITALDNYKAGDLVSLRIVRADSDPKVPCLLRPLPPPPPHSLLCSSHRLQPSACTFTYGAAALLHAHYGLSAHGMAKWLMRGNLATEYHALRGVLWGVVLEAVANLAAVWVLTYQASWFHFTVARSL